MLRRIAFLVGWCGAAFLVHAAFALSTHFREPEWIAAGVYLLGFAAMFPLHANTRGPLSMALAFALCWALLVEGLAYALVRDDASPVVTALLALPLVALVVRRSPVDEHDAWFARRRRRAVPLALALAAPPLFVGFWGARQADPAPYERAARVLGDTPLEEFAVEFAGSERPARARARWTAFHAPRTGVAQELRDEVERACGGFAAAHVTQATRCASALLASRSRAVARRRDVFVVSALVSAVPLAIALLFAWRGRRGAPGVHASEDGVSDD
ncbi:MAG TPA: hypothetical protein VFZ53_09305 [Polyangiaceae bacterium]